MSIYKPVSSIANSLLSVGSGALSGVTNVISSKVQGLIPSTQLGQIANGLAQSAISQASSELNRRVSAGVSSAAYNADRKISNAKNSILNAFGLGLFDTVGMDSNGLYDSGGLSLRDIYDIWKQTDPDSLSRSNFYVIEINDRSGNAPVSRDGGSKFSRFNLFCTDLSFNSFELQDEPVDVGSIVLSKPMSSQRTEMSLTLYDDRLGSIKKWAEQKSVTAAQSNGLFMPPINYIFDVRVVFGTNIDDDDFYNQTYTMKIASMQHQLTRDNVDMEKIQLQFTQFDTCMPSFGG